jgi:sugar phosphate isomerase/epimerase
VKYFRATLPLAGVAAVRNLGSERATVPSYRESVAAPDLLRNLRLTLQHLSRRAKLAGVCVLLEIHWGTVMSSCTGAHALVRDLDPDAIAIRQWDGLQQGMVEWPQLFRLLAERGYHGMLSRKISSSRARMTRRSSI